MADMRQYRRCRNCGAVLAPTDSFCPQCGIDTERSYEPANYPGSPPREDQGNMRRQGAGSSPVNRQGGALENRAEYPPRERQNGARREQPGYPSEDRQKRGTTYEQTSREHGVMKSERNAQREEYTQNTRRSSHPVRYQSPSSSGSSSNRCRQENLEGNWSEDWGRTVDESKTTPVQYILIILLVVLLAALIGLGAFWIFGRSGGKGDRQQAAVQTEEKKADSSEDIITILDSGENQKNAGQAGISEGQTAAEQSGEKQGTSEGQTSAEREQKGTSEEQTSGEQAAEQSENAGEQSSGQDTASKDQTETQASGQNVNAGAENAEQSGSQNDGQNSSAKAENTEQIGIQQSTAASWSRPESSERLLTESELEGLTYDELQMVINEIYARHGRIFKDPEIGNYFESQSWYQGTLDADHFDASVFNEVENQNIQQVLERMGDG